MTVAIPRRKHGTTAPSLVLIVVLGLLVGVGLGLGWHRLARARPRPEAILDNAQDLARAGRFSEADALLQSVAPGPLPAECLLRAQVATALERTDEALDSLSKIPDDDPLGPLARLSEGQIEARRGRLRLAEVAFRKTLKLLPGCIQAHRELVYILSIQQRLDELDDELAALSEAGSLDLEHLIHWSRVHQNAWSAAGDLPSLQRYVAADSEDVHSRRAVVEALIRLGRLDEAATELGALRSSDEAIVLAAMLAEARNDPAELDRLLATGSERHFELARLRGRRALARRDAAAAIRWFSVAREIRPGDRATAVGLASALNLADNRAGAAPYLAQVQKLDALGTLLARTESRRGDLEAGLARDLGLGCLDVGRIREARAWLRYAIARDPSDAQAQQSLARLSAPSGPV